jgi:hypothetical protein
MKQETTLFFDSILREDRSVMDLLSADYTFVNERLARHYGVPNVYGSQFRRIKVPSDARRGLLGQASILMVTSYPNRTSPVERGKWILTNLLGVPPSPPPPNVPPLKEESADGKPRSLRESLEAHRANPVCAGCHRAMDPIGFSMENFDGVGHWRTTDHGLPIDSSGTLFNGATVDGVAGLRQMLASNPNVFVGVMTEKMLTYAIGRGQSLTMTCLQFARSCRMPEAEISSLSFSRWRREKYAVSVQGGQMRIITRTHLSRRTFLRGVGVTMALPFLESMVPAQTPLARTAANPQIRLGMCFIPHGAVMANWTPAEVGALKLSEPWLLSSPIRTRSSCSAILAHKMAGPQGPGDNGGDHTRCPAVFLNGVHPKRTDGADIFAGVTIDQMAARKIGQDTLLPSLELATEDYSGLVGSCDVGFSCTYMNTISWSSNTTPMPMEMNPRVVFDRMFGDGATPAERLERIERQRSILDAVTGQIRRLQGNLGPNDRNRVAEYLDTVREIERRIQLAEKQTADSKLNVPASPSGVPDDHQEHSKLMFDLMAIAFQADITRVSTFMMAREVSYRTFPMLGILEGFHPASHHQNNAAKLEALTKINSYHVALCAHLLEDVKRTPDGDGNLLDHSLILYGSAMSNSNVHDHSPLPVLVAGGANGRMKGGRHTQVSGRNADVEFAVEHSGQSRNPTGQRGDSTGNFEGTLGDLTSMKLQRITTTCLTLLLLFCAIATFIAAPAAEVAMPPRTKTPPLFRLC